MSKSIETTDWGLTGLPSFFLDDTDVCQAKFVVQVINYDAKVYAVKVGKPDVYYCYDADLVLGDALYLTVADARAAVDGLTRTAAE